MQNTHREAERQEKLMPNQSLPQLSEARIGHASRVRLERCPQLDCVNGDPTTGYELTLPLDRDGEIDPLVLARDPVTWQVRRFEKDHPDLTGGLAHDSAGGWVCRYGNDQEARYDQLTNSSRFRPNSIIDVLEGGQVWAYRVTSIGPV